MSGDWSDGVNLFNITQWYSRYTLFAKTLKNKFVTVMSLPWKGALEVVLYRLGTLWDAGGEGISLIAIGMVGSWEE